MDNGIIHAISSGTTTITVKAEENSVKDEIEINVYSPVTDISIDQKEISMQKDDTLKLMLILSQKMPIIKI